MGQDGSFEKEHLHVATCTPGKQSGQLSFCTERSASAPSRVFLPPMLGRITQSHSGQDGDNSLGNP